MTHIYYGIENEEVQAVLMGCPGREVHFLSQSQLLPAFFTEEFSIIFRAIQNRILRPTNLQKCDFKKVRMASDSRLAMERIRTHRNPYEQIQTHRNPYEPIGTHMNRTRRKPMEPIGTQVKQKPKT